MRRFPHFKMFHAALFLLGVGLLLGQVLPASGATPAADNEPLLAAGDRVVFVGDSITGLGQNQRIGFVHLIDEAMKEASTGPSPTLIALGGSGHSVASWLNIEKGSRDKPSFLDVKNVDVKATLDAGADVVVVMLGMNDVLAPYVGPDEKVLERWADRYRQLIEVLKARTNARVIALATIPPCTEDPDSPRNRLIGLMNQRIEALAGEFGGACLPVNAAVFDVLRQGRELNPAFHVTRDYVHPNEAGHLGIAIGMLRGLGQTAAADHLVARVATLVAASAQPAEAIAEPPAWLVGTGFVQPWKDGVFNAQASRTPVDEAIEKGEDFTAPIEVAKGKTLTWQTYVPSVNYVGGAAPGSVDFTAVTVGGTFESAYAARWIHSERARRAQLQLSMQTFAGDQYVTVWLNGKKVYENQLNREPRRRTVMEVDLRAGWNVLALKSNHRTWQWQMSAELLPMNGDSHADLRYAAAAPSDRGSSAVEAMPAAGEVMLAAGEVPPVASEVPPAAGQVMLAAGEIPPAAGEVSPAAGELPPAAGDFTAPVVRYHLDEPGQVTLVIEDQHGRRVRNLLVAERDAGDHEQAWDGLDDAGQPVTPGEYRWRGLTHAGITTHFQGAFNSPGSPPWLTQRPVRWNLRSGTHGGWLSDHAPPLCSFAVGDRIFLGAAIAEAGHSIIQVDPEGNKQLGILWLSLGAANALAVEDDVLYAASEKGWMRDWLAVNRFDLKKSGLLSNPPEMRASRTDGAFVKEKMTDFSGIRGIVLTPEAIVLSLADHNRLAFFDRENAKHLRDVPLPQAGAIIKTPSGKYLGISGRQVVRLDLEKGVHQPVITEDLGEPAGLAVDSDGTIYVTDLATEEQCIKVFSADGRLQRRIGTPGGRGEGAFDPQAMSQPTSVSIDGRGQLWVTEHDFLPKRVSVWSRDGQLIRDFIGGPSYGGGGALDSEDPHVAYFQGMAFRWENWPGGYRLMDVLFRLEAHPDLPLETTLFPIPQIPMRRNGRLYLVQDANYGIRGVFIGEVREHRLAPRVIFGKLDALRAAWGERHAEYVRSLPETPRGVFLWVDQNEDGQADPSEVSVQPDWRFGSLWGMRIGPDLTIHAQTKEAIIALSPTAGVDRLSYDLNEARVIPKPAIVSKKGINALAADLEGNLIVNTGGGANQGDPENVLVGVSPAGDVLWTYPNPYPANWHDSPRPRLGDIQHTLNVEGVARIGEEAGDVFVLNGNKGVRYLFTTDGLFVDQLFGDSRFAPWQQSLTEVAFDMPMQDVSLVDECFAGWFGRGDDGRFRQVVGKESSNVLEVRGLETIRRLEGASLVLAAAATPKAEQADEIRAPLAVCAGNITDNWMRISSRAFPTDQPVARFAMGASENHLHLRVDVTDDSPFVNTGEDASSLFKTGDAVDLRLAIDPDLPATRMTPGAGDVRIVLAMHQGKPVAIRYRFVVPGTKQPVAFGRYSIDEVSVLEKTPIHVQRNESGYTLKASIRWTDLGLSERPTRTLLGDVGVIFSDPTGSRSVARHYYFDPGSQAVSDLPTEASVYPGRWGPIRF